METKTTNETSQKHILVATGMYPPAIGGPATYAKLLNDRLGEFGYSVTIVSFDTLLGVPKLLRHLIYFKRVLLQGRRADAIFALDPVSVGLPSVLAARLLRKRFFIRIAGDYAWEQGTQRFGVKESLDEFYTHAKEIAVNYSRRVRMLQHIQNWVTNQAEAVIVPSQYLKNIVVRWGIPEDRIVVIYNAFSPETLTDDRDTIRAALHLSGTVLVSVGRLVPWKGFAVLIDAMRELRFSIPDAKLYIVGEGPEKSRLAGQVMRQGLEGKVLLVGQKSHEEVLRYLAAADLFLLNTGYEGLSHLLLEAMSSRIPIVTTPVGGNTELIEHEKNGLLVPYNDREGFIAAANRLALDRPLRDRLSKAAHEKVEQFDESMLLAEVDAFFTKYLV